MMAEIFAARQEMGLEELKDLGKRSTERLEKLHTKTMAEFRLWTEEKEKLASLPKEPNTLLAVQAGLINQDEAKELEMAKDKKKDEKKTAKRTGPVEKPEKAKKPDPIGDREAFEAMAVLLWKEEDRPDVAGMTDDQVREELKESVGLLAPEDEMQLATGVSASTDPIPHADRAAEVWAFFCGLRKDLAAKEVKVKSEKVAKVKEPKPKKEKVVKEPGPPGVIASIKEFLISAGADGISKKGLLKKLVQRFPGKKEDSMKATINVQVPSRLAKENNLEIQKKTSEEGTLYFVA